MLCQVVAQWLLPGAGCAGWCHEHVRVLMDRGTAVTQQVVTSFMQAQLLVPVSEQVADLYSCARLIAFDKGGGLGS